MCDRSLQTSKHFSNPVMGIVCALSWVSDSFFETLPLSTLPQSRENGSQDLLNTEVGETLASHSWQKTAVRVVKYGPVHCRDEALRTSATVLVACVTQTCAIFFKLLDELMSNNSPMVQRNPVRTTLFSDLGRATSFGRGPFSKRYWEDCILVFPS